MTKFKSFFIILLVIILNSLISSMVVVAESNKQVITHESGVSMEFDNEYGDNVNLNVLVYNNKTAEEYGLSFINEVNYVYDISLVINEEFITESDFIVYIPIPADLNNKKLNLMKFNGQDLEYLDYELNDEYICVSVNDLSQILLVSKTTWFTVLINVFIAILLLLLILSIVYVFILANKKGFNNLTTIAGFWRPNNRLDKK